MNNELSMNNELIMDNICFCTGRAVVNKNRKWYKTIDNANIFCENCYNEYNNYINAIQFILMFGKDYSCSWDKDFSDSSLCYNNIRISVINPDVFYRYKKIKSTNTTLTLGLPNKQKYMILVESCDKSIKLTVNNILHDNIENEYYGNPEYFHLIDKMSYNDDLIFNDSNKNIISFYVTKWKKVIDDNGNHYIMQEEPIQFSIKLSRNENERIIMNEEIEFYKSIKDNNNNDKIIIIDNFI